MISTARQVCGQSVSRAKRVDARVRAMPVFTVKETQAIIEALRAAAVGCLFLCLCVCVCLVCIFVKICRTQLGGGD